MIMPLWHLFMFADGEQEMDGAAELNPPAPEIKLRLPA
jgi:hypothetical protein